MNKFIGAAFNTITIIRENSQVSSKCICGIHITEVVFVLTEGVFSILFLYRYLLAGGKPTKEFTIGQVCCALKTGANGVGLVGVGAC